MSSILQSAEARTTSSVASLELAFDTNVTQNNLLVVSAQIWAPAQMHADAVTDTQTNDYQQDAVSTNFVANSLFSAKAGASSANTVTVTPTANAFLSMVIAELDGMATTSWFDASVNANGTSATPDGGTLTTGAQGGLALWSVTHLDGGSPTLTAPTNWTDVEEEEDTVNANPYNVAFRLTDPSTGYGTQGAAGASVRWDVVAANYKASSEINQGTLGYLRPNNLRPAIFAPGIPR